MQRRATLLRKTERRRFKVENLIDPHFADFLQSRVVYPQFTESVGDLGM